MSWFVLRTQSRAEERALWHLKNQGFEVYLPRYHKRIRHARKTEIVMRPLFPGYLFVQVDIGRQCWHAINGTVGVVSLVQFGAEPMPINDAIVDSIRGREGESGAVNLAPMGLEIGDSVHVREGAFANHTALLEEVSDSKRVIMLLNLMGREVRVSAPIENLTKVS